MLIFYFLIIIIGLGSGLWLLLHQNKKDSYSIEPDILEKLRLGQTSAHNKKPLDPEPSLKISKAPPEDTFDGDTIEKELTLETSLRELKEKYERLDGLFKEKSEELEKKEKALANELKTHKDFNKVKDILEKEIKDNKEQIHKLNLEMAALNSEIENQKRRNIQLEDKIKSREVEIKQKEKQIDDLITRLQTFATPPQPKVPEPQNIIPEASKPPESQVQTEPLPAPEEPSLEKQRPTTEFKNPPAEPSPDTLKPEDAPAETVTIPEKSEVIGTPETVEGQQSSAADKKTEPPQENLAQPSS